jgi:hypothetical protein
LRGIDAKVLMKLSLLRNLMLLDAAILALLGGFMIVCPGLVTQLFQFANLPTAVNYIVGLWGCALLTLGFGYVGAACDPLRNKLWIQMGLARGGLEVALGIIYLIRHDVLIGQAGLGTIAVGVLTIGYVILFPKSAK